MSTASVETGEQATCPWLHSWRPAIVTMGMLKRGVEGRRVCKKCKAAQITKASYPWWNKWRYTEPAPTDGKLLSED